jgi:hypothetical protein
MTTFRKITARDKPETIARAAASHELHLKEALQIALRRAVRSEPLVRELLQNATVEGVANHLNAKVAVVSFAVPLFKQSWHHLIPWQILNESTPTETAGTLAWSLRESIRRNRRESKVSARSA